MPVQAAFHVFGMELLAIMDLKATNNFFATFFNLPPFFWRGFLGSTLSSSQLIAFALVTFVLAPLSIKARLVWHLIANPAGGYMVQQYFGKPSNPDAGSRHHHGMSHLVIIKPCPV